MSRSCATTLSADQELTCTVTHRSAATDYPNDYDKESGLYNFDSADDQLMSVVTHRTATTDSPDDEGKKKPQLLEQQLDVIVGSAEIRV